MRARIIILLVRSHKCFVNKVCDQVNDICGMCWHQQLMRCVNFINNKRRTTVNICYMRSLVFWFIVLFCFCFYSDMNDPVCVSVHNIFLAKHVQGVADLSRIFLSECRYTLLRFCRRYTIWSLFWNKLPASEKPLNFYFCMENIGRIVHQAIV